MVKSIELIEQIKKIGNSKGVIIPIKPLAILNLEINDWVRVTIEKIDDFDKIEHIRHEIVFKNNEDKKPK